MSMRQLKITKSITNRESQSLEKYLQEIGRVELIGSEEEVKLAELLKPRWTRRGRPVPCRASARRGAAARACTGPGRTPRLSSHGTQHLKKISNKI